MNIEFKKLDKETYLVNFGDKQMNVHLRYSSLCKHYEVDAGYLYFEENTIAKIKNKITSYILQGKFENLY